MPKIKKILLIVLIIIIILSVFSLIFSDNKIIENTSQIKGNIEMLNSSDEKVIEEMTLSVEKTQEAMENNSRVLQQAIDSVSNSGGGTVKLPAGTYYFAPINTYTNIASSQKRAYYAVECRDNVKIVGAGTNENNSSLCTILKPYGSNLDLSFTMFQYISQSVPKVFLENADFADFIIDANETSKAPDASYIAQGKGFSFQAFKDCDWNNVIVRNTDGTGFGMDYPISSTVTNCVAIGCGKAASDSDAGASGFGIGTGYSEDESMKISDCLAIGNKKFGFFFEHQGRFEPDITARTAKGFVVKDCVARGNMYNFGGEKSNDLVFINCASEKSRETDPNPLGNENKIAFYFGTNARRSYVKDCTIEEKFDNVTQSDSYYSQVYWGAENSIIDIGGERKEYDALANCYNSAAVTMIWRYAGRPGEVLLYGEQPDSGYVDVGANDWFVDALAWAYNEGIVSGGGNFNAGNDCTRAEFITMLWKYAGRPTASAENDYTDIEESDYFYEAVNWAVNNGILRPEGNEFYPSDPIINADALNILYRYDELTSQRVVIYDYWENGGNDSEKVYEIKYKGENIDLNVEARKTGYEFIGWSTNENATTGTASLRINNDNIYLYAIYRKDIRILYDANGGSNVPAAQTGVIYNNQEGVDIRLSSGIPQREGYIFKGWTDIKGSEEVKYRQGETHSFKDSCTLYAVWEEDTDIDTYTLTVMPNGGTWNNSTQNVEINGEPETVIDISNPIPPQGITVLFDGNEGITQEESKTSEKYFENWTLNGAGRLNGKSYIFGEGSASIKANYTDSGIEMPSATRDGYIFRGWTDQRDSSQVKYREGETYIFDDDCTLYAVWEEDTDIDTYTLTVMPNGGTWNNSTQNVEINGEPETVIDISNPIPPQGITVLFDGNEGITQEESKTSEKYFENWTLNGAGRLNGKSYIFGEGSASIKANYTDSGIEMPSATRDGYIFRGWTDQRDSSQVKYREGETYIFDDDCTLYAVWGKEEEEKYLVTYNYSYNGGENSEKSQEEKLSGEKVDLDVEATKTGYEFIGWSTDRDAKEGLKNLVMENEDITLYAIFKKDISINFIDYNGTEENRTEQKITIYNNDKGEITAPKINQYSDWTTRYWTISKEADSEQTVEDEGVITDISENQTYFARYTKEILISFDLNEGEGVLPETISGNIEVNSNNINNVKGFEVIVPDADISREGFRFSGWMTKKDETGIDYGIGDEVSFISDTVLYAKWVDNNVPIDDDNLPVLEVEYNSDGWTNQDIELLISATDEDSGIDKVTVNDEVILENDGDCKFVIKENGTYEIIVIDKAGNSTSKVIRISNIDKVLPSIYKIEIDEKELKVTTIDNESGTSKIEYSFDGENWYDLLDENNDKEFTVINYVYKAGESFAVLEFNNQVKTMYFRAVDEAGNIGEGKLAEVNDENNGNDNDEPNNNVNNISGNNINSNMQQEENSDGSTANKWLPHAGRSTIIILIIIISVTAIIFRKKYNDLKDIK